MPDPLVPLQATSRIRAKIKTATTPLASQVEDPNRPASQIHDVFSLRDTLPAAPAPSITLTHPPLPPTGDPPQAPTPTPTHAHTSTTAEAAAEAPTEAEANNRTETPSPRALVTAIAIARGTRSRSRSEGASAWSASGALPSALAGTPRGAYQVHPPGVTGTAGNSPGTHDTPTLTASPPLQPPPSSSPSPSLSPSGNSGNARPAGVDQRLITVSSPKSFLSCRPSALPPQVPSSL